MSWLNFFTCDMLRDIGNLSSFFKPFSFKIPAKRYLANSEDPDEMQHNAVFYLDIYCLQRYIIESCTTRPFERLNVK